VATAVALLPAANSSLSGDTAAGFTAARCAHAFTRVCGSGCGGGTQTVSTTVQVLGGTDVCGVVTEYATVNQCARAITTGPNGNLWFAGEEPDVIGTITTAGSVTLYPIPYGP
jgi:streptogramin lyase